MFYSTRTQTNIETYAAPFFIPRPPENIRTHARKLKTFNAHIIHTRYLCVTCNRPRELGAESAAQRPAKSAQFHTNAHEISAPDPQP